jgi:hypothetical protein
MASFASASTNPSGFWLARRSATSMAALPGVAGRSGLGGGRPIPPQAEGKREYRLLRGGSWIVNPNACRAAFRYSDHPGDANTFIGLRPCCLLPPRTCFLIPQALDPSALGLSAKPWKFGLGVAPSGPRFFSTIRRPRWLCQAR